MGSRRSYYVVFLVLLCCSASSWNAQEAMPDPPRALVYSAPLLRGARATALDVDASGRIYLGGVICESTLPVTANAAQPTYAGGCDGFVAILGPDGRLQYASYLGGSQQERIAAIDADAAGNVYVGGDTSSSDFPATAGAYDVTCGANGTCTAGTLDGFVTRFAPSGAVVYSTFLGGLDTEFVLGIAADSSGRAHVAGYTSSPDFPTTPGAASGTYLGGSDAFYTRLEPSGAAVSYSTFISGEGSENAVAVVLDSADAAYITGSTDSHHLTTFRALQPSLRGESDAWLMKIAADRTLNYITYFGGSGADSGFGLTVQGSSVFVAGFTCSSDLPMAAPRAALCSGGFVTKIAADGGAVRRTAIVEGTDGRAVAVDAQDRAFLLGNRGPSFTTTPDAFQPVQDSFGSATLAVVPLGEAATPEVEYSTYVGTGGPIVTLPPERWRWWRLHRLAVHQRRRAGRISDRQRAIRIRAGRRRRDALCSRIADGEQRPGRGRDLRGGCRHGCRKLADRIGRFGRARTEASEPNNGAGKLAVPLAAPTDYVEFQFEAEAGVNYRLWLRGRADNDNWANDSVFVQFSDSVDSGGHPPGGSARRTAHPSISKTV